VFSLGVVCYEMLFGRKPYDIHPTHTQVDIAMLSYLSRWHYSPESELSAAPTVLAVLVGVISRCLSPLPEDRPELDWIALILRHCCELLQ
jgi:serine/threonine protein kinase